MVVGVTGGIGSGKSTVCRAISTLGYPIYLSDERGNFLMNNNKKVIDQIVSEFSEKAYVDGRLDRKYLSEMVFGNHEKLKKLESIVHPAVFEDFELFKSSHGDEKLIFVESAILFESGMDLLTDKIITISAPEELRISRVAKRDNANVAAIQKRIKSQMSDSERESRSGFTIICDDNNSVLVALLDIIDKLIDLK